MSVRNPAGSRAVTAQASITVRVSFAVYPPATLPVSASNGGIGLVAIPSWAFVVSFWPEATYAEDAETCVVTSSEVHLR